MPLLDDICENWLPTQIGSLVFGTNLFAGIMPDAPDAPDLCTALFEYGGTEPMYTFGPTMTPAISQPGLQVLVRAPVYPDGRTLIDQIVETLETVCNQTINGTYYERLARTQDPFLSHRDPARRAYLMCNLSVMKSN